MLMSVINGQSYIYIYKSIFESPITNAWQWWRCMIFFLIICKSGKKILGKYAKKWEIFLNCLWFVKFSNMKYFFTFLPPPMGTMVWVNTHTQKKMLRKKICWNDLKYNIKREIMFETSGTVSSSSSSSSLSGSSAPSEAKFSVTASQVPDLLPRPVPSNRSSSLST